MLTMRTAPVAASSASPSRRCTTARRVLNDELGFSYAACQSTQCWLVTRRTIPSKNLDFLGFSVAIAIERMYALGMFEAIEQIEIPTDSAGLIELLATHDRFTAKVHEAVADFDADGGWDADAATSMHAWLRDHARM